MTELTLNLHQDDYAYLELEAEETGLDPAAVVTMLVRKARKASEKPEGVSALVADVQRAAAAKPDEERRRMDVLVEIERKRMAREAEEQRQREVAEKKARLLAELAALAPPTEAEIDKAVASADAWMKGSMFDPNRPDEFDESQLPREPVLEHHAHGVVIAPPRNAGVGSLTAPAGIRSDLQRGHVIGDPQGNIIRQNFGHLGAR